MCRPYQEWRTAKWHQEPSGAYRSRESLARPALSCCHHYYFSISCSIATKCTEVSACISFPFYATYIGIEEGRHGGGVNIAPVHEHVGTRCN